MKILPACIVCAGLSASAFAQTAVYGFDFRSGSTFRSNVNTFVGSYTTLSAVPDTLFALDLDVFGLRLFAADNATREIVEIGTASGLIGPVRRPINGLIGSGSNDFVTGLTASPDGTTWWLSRTLGSVTQIYSGNVESGSFGLVGAIPNETIIDIAMNSNGELFGLSLVGDKLVSISTSTGEATTVGIVGPDLQFGQGMDFDWSDDTLYAALYEGSGVGSFCTIDTQTGGGTFLESTIPLDAQMEIAVFGYVDASFGDVFCSSLPNSTGAVGSLTAFGSLRVADDNVALVASRLPTVSFGYFLASRTRGFSPMPGGSQGNLCLDANIGRYVGPGQIQNSGQNGEFSLSIALGQIPQSNGFVAASAGETWNFQTWFRDSLNGQATSNFTSAIEVTFE